MARKVKCPTCKTLNDKENTEKLDNRYYCLECAEKRKVEKNRNIDDWDELFEYICDLYDIDVLTGMMFKQIKDFRTDYNYTNKGMYLTLKYYYEILDNEVKDNTGLGIIPYYYDRAKQHYIDILEVKKHLKNFEIDEQTNIVKIKNIDIKEIKKRKQLPLDNIDWDGA